MHCPRGIGAPAGAAVSTAAAGGAPARRLRGSSIAAPGADVTQEGLEKTGGDTVEDMITTPTGGPF
jgi:hypothetical protein